MDIPEEKRLPNLHGQQLGEPLAGHCPRLGHPKFIYDYALCADTRELEQSLQQINASGWEIISVTEPRLCVFHVFFRRPTHG